MSGTLAPLKAAINADGAAADPAGATVSFIQIAAQGTQGGIDDVDDDAYLFHFSGLTAGAGHTIGALGNEPTWTSKTRLIKCLLQGVGITNLIAVDP